MGALLPFSPSDGVPSFEAVRHSQERALSTPFPTMKPCLIDQRTINEGCTRGMQIMLVREIETLASFSLQGNEPLEELQTRSPRYRMQVLWVGIDPAWDPSQGSTVAQSVFTEQRLQYIHSVEEKIWRLQEATGICWVCGQMVLPVQCCVGGGWGAQRRPNNRLFLLCVLSVSIGPRVFMAME